MPPIFFAFIYNILCSFVALNADNDWIFLCSFSCHNISPSLYIRHGALPPWTARSAGAVACALSLVAPLVCVAILGFIR